MKTWDEIDVNEKLSLEEFCTLFSNLPLNEEEIKELPNYHEIYESFITSEVQPVDAWIAVRNIFAIKNQQVGERIKQSRIDI